MNLRRDQDAWTRDDVDLLKKLTRLGLSAREIGAKMRRTRNAVIGKWYRERNK